MCRNYVGEYQNGYEVPPTFMSFQFETQSDIMIWFRRFIFLQNGCANQPSEWYISRLYLDKLVLSPCLDSISNKMHQLTF